jgi:hypothetical protein
MVQPSTVAVDAVTVVGFDTAPAAGEKVGVAAAVEAVGNTLPILMYCPNAEHVRRSTKTSKSRLIASPSN